MDVFTGRILGVGTGSGVRLVVGCWDSSPLGAFADVMVAAADGTRTLLAPTRPVADYIASTYTFDAVQVGPLTARIVDVPGGRHLVVSHERLHLVAVLGSRTPLGRLLRLVPERLATSTTYATVCDPVARVALRGVRTRGSAGGGRREYYAARDMAGVDSVAATLDGADLGALAPVWPPPRFGFSGTPRRPCLVEVTTTVVG